MAGQWDEPRADDNDPVFGRKQTQWDDEDDGDKPVRRRANAVASAAEYHALRPEPNYSQFKAQFVDSRGREYALALHLDDKTDPFESPPLTGSVKAKRLLLSLRMPIRQRHTVPLPEPDGEALELYHVATQVLCTAKTDGVWVAGPRQRTGSVYVRDFISHGQVSDPKTYEAWLRGEPEEKEWF
jgi:hypothetical protein